MAVHSSILAWKNPWTKEPGGLESIRWKIVRHHWAAGHTTRIRAYTGASDPSMKALQTHLKPQDLLCYCCLPWCLYSIFGFISKLPISFQHVGFAGHLCSVFTSFGTDVSFGVPCLNNPTVSFISSQVNCGIIYLK